MDTPEHIRDTYQYFTEADLTKLRANGYSAPFRSLEEGIDDYVKKHLILQRRARLEQLLANPLELGDGFGALKRLRRPSGPEIAGRRGRQHRCFAPFARLTLP